MFLFIDNLFNLWPWKNCLLCDVVSKDKIFLKNMFNVTPIIFNAALLSFYECENGFLNRLLTQQSIQKSIHSAENFLGRYTSAVLRYIVPKNFQHCFELIFNLCDVILCDFCDDFHKTLILGLFASNLIETSFCIAYHALLILNLMGVFVKTP